MRSQGPLLPLIPQIMAQAPGNVGGGAGQAPQVQAVQQPGPFALFPSAVDDAVLDYSTKEGIYI